MKLSSDFPTQEVWVYLRMHTHLLTHMCTLYVCMYVYTCMYILYICIFKSKCECPLLSTLVTFLIAMTKNNLEGVTVAYILREHAVYRGREGMATSHGCWS